MSDVHHVGVSDIALAVICFGAVVTIVCLGVLLVLWYRDWKRNDPRS